jgi:hypothetical protein
MNDFLADHNCSGRIQFRCDQQVNRAISQCAWKHCLLFVFVFEKRLHHKNFPVFLFPVWVDTLPLVICFVKASRLVFEQFPLRISWRRIRMLQIDGQ